MKQWQCENQGLKCVHLLGRPELLSGGAPVRSRFGGHGINFIWNLICSAFLWDIKVFFQETVLTQMKQLLIVMDVSQRSSKETKTILWVSQFKRCWAKVRRPRAADGWDFSERKGELGMFKQSVHEIPSTSLAVNTRKRDNQVVAWCRQRWKRSLTIFLCVSTGQSWARLNADYGELREKKLKT